MAATASAMSPEGAALRDGGKESGIRSTAREKQTGGDENTIRSAAESQDPAQTKRRKAVIYKTMNLQERVEAIQANNEKKRLIA